jgi:hypothetical protein
MIELLAFAAQALTMANAPQLNWPQDRGPHAGAAAVEVLIDPQGKGLRCDISASVGDDKTIRQICPLLLARSWKPATAGGPEPVYSVYRDVAKLRRGGEVAMTDAPIPSRSVEQVMQTEQLADYVLPPAQPRGSRGKAASVQAMVLVGSNGLITACDASTSKGERKLREAACAALPGRKLKRQSDAAGQPVAYVTTVKVEFG